MAVGCASLALAGCIGFGVASAGNAPSEEGAFGLDASAAATSAEQRPVSMTSTSAAVDDSSLESTSQRDISLNVEAIDEQLEAERKAAEELAAAEEAERIAAAEAAKAVQQQAASQDAAAAELAALPDVDWSVGEEAFVAEWTQRIDAYLAGSPLAGQGATFAQAAWNNGVDPRWSPAIANTESSKGAICFLPYNAWGWGSSSWSSWEEAINAHVAGLASGYGYSLTYAAAQKYCPPNYDHWFHNTLSQMMIM
ncbi:MAG TPA: CMP-2-keto-3-deoxyoctulosonic acid synthetase [Candidatus Aphodovivens avistercoris]|nr:CMP-2-keto-3-deoxyoctulosonic acid synthetase [Candidatus Aphodovivens avistercoris]